MSDFIDILKIVIPSIVVFFAGYMVLKSFLDSEAKKREYEIRKASLSVVTPVRLQAYERIVIFLERMHPNNVVLRTNKIGMTSHQLHSELIKAVKSEYEHNISQQIYVSSGAWELIKTAKEETLKIINISSTKVPENAKSQELAQVILQLAASVEKLPSQYALEYLKREIAQIY